jgi:hypothetical protein
MAKLDPIYVALAACDEARKHFKRSCTIAELQSHDFNDRTDDAMGSLIGSFKKVVETLPTTEAGLLAKLAFAHEFDEHYPSVFDEEDIFPTLIIAA